MERFASGTRGWSLMAVLATTTVVLVVLAIPASSDSDEPELPTEVGLASFYGPGFQGEKTASGEIFDQNRMVAAHRKLPLGSVVRVTNLDNGRQVILRVIDRGPYGRNYRKGTIIDVSKGAAQRLDFIEDGLVRVRIEVLELPESEKTGAG
jgi:rare lipoprotein A